MNRLEQIRNKPVVELTPEEIDMLTREEQRWVWDYLGYLRQRDEAESQRVERKAAKREGNDVHD